LGYSNLSSSGVSRAFGDDALGYFTERLDPAPTRVALAAVLHRAKRNKAFEGCRFVGLALDGTTAGRRRKSGCSLCRPYRNADREILGYRIWSKISNALKNLGFRSRNFLAQLLAETSRACTIRIRRSSFREALE
jgi:hypothetical protein